MKNKLLALLLVAAATHASASVVFTDRAAWTSSANVTQTIGFEGMAPDNSYAYQGAAVTVDGVGFSGNSGLYAVGGSYAEGGGTFGVGTGVILFSYSTGIQGVLPAAYSAFGVDVRGYDESSTAFSITFSDGESFNVTANNPGGVFFGALLDNAVTGFSIVPTGSYVAIDNVAFGDTGNNVPEPASLALVGLGLAGLAVSRRRKLQA